MRVEWWACKSSITLPTNKGIGVDTSPFKVLATDDMPTRCDPESSYCAVMRCAAIAKALVSFDVLIDVAQAFVADTAGKYKVQGMYVSRTAA